MSQVKGMKILIVDDNKGNLVDLENLLKQLEITIIKATSGEEALRLLGDNDVFLVLMDVSMPGIDGFETAELMRDNERLKNIPIMFLTLKKIQQKYVFRGYELGAVDYLFKPVEPVILISKVKVFMDIYEKNYRLIEKKTLLQEKIKELTDLKKSNCKLERLSFYDSLTGINNRRRFDETLNIEWNRAMRKQSEISIIMIDVDNFKSYNDHYGHNAGDECLKKVANVLYNTVKRSTDTVARYGGEEFTALLPDTDNRGAMNIAERIRKNIENLDIKHEYSGLHKKLTVSLGVNSIVPSPNKEKQEFIENADKALYRAKHNKKNIVYNSLRV